MKYNSSLLTSSSHLTQKSSHRWTGLEMPWQWWMLGTQSATSETSKLHASELLIRYAAGERDFSQENLRDEYLGWEDLMKIDLSHATLEIAILEGTNLMGANLQNANLCRADLTAAKLQGANLTEADLYRADLRGTDLRDAQFIGADLTTANLTGADLPKGVREAESSRVLTGR